LGWENVSSVSEEVKNPEDTFRKTIPWAIFCVGGLYILIAWVYLAAVPAGLRLDNPTVLVPILQTVFGNNIAMAGSLVAVILLILATNSWVLGASRQVYSLARNNVLPATLSSLTGCSGIPRNALLFLACGYGLVTLCISNAGWSEEWLIRLANSNFMLIYFGAFTAGLTIFKSKKMKACAWLAIFATVSFAPFFGWMILVSSCLMAICYAWLFYLSKRRRKAFS
jgi:amino acid efflux transporter